MTSKKTFLQTLELLEKVHGPVKGVQLRYDVRRDGVIVVLGEDGWYKEVRTIRQRPGEPFWRFSSRVLEVEGQFERWFAQYGGRKVLCDPESCNAGSRHMRPEGFPRDTDDCRHLEILGGKKYCRD
jgi:hypothetical protein